MPSEVFMGLSEEKRNKVYEACKQEFERHPFSEARVSNIIQPLNIARGSFYQYFKDLKDCYFYVLSRETVEVHEEFMKLLVAHHFDFFKTLEAYEAVLIRHLIDSENRSLYRYRSLFWNKDLEEGWREYRAKNQVGHAENYFTLAELEDYGDMLEMMQFLKALIHQLSYRLFTENWSAEEFSQHYRQQMAWVKHGINPEQALKNLVQA